LVVALAGRGFAGTSFVAAAVARLCGGAGDADFSSLFDDGFADTGCATAATFEVAFFTGVDFATLPDAAARAGEAFVADTGLVAAALAGAGVVVTLLWAAFFVGATVVLADGAEAAFFAATGFFSAVLDVAVEVLGRGGIVLSISSSDKAARG
jgi:hypothetical protein